MSKNDRPPIIALDGNHRTGKGTQLDILSGSLTDKGFSPLILRGDGTRPGRGEMEGDPLSSWWQNFKDYANNHENAYIAWRIGARTLLAEAAVHTSNLPESSIILFDRHGVSRSQMTLQEGLPVTYDNLYKKGVADTRLDDETLLSLQPDITIHLSASTKKLLGRLDPNDPKYNFRKDNILKSNEFFETGFDAYAALGLGATRRIWAEGSIESMADKIKDAIISEIDL